MTSAAESRRDEQVHRIHRYLITMGIRTVCFLLAVVTDGWIRWVCAVLAVVLPYVAVVMANAVRPVRAGESSPVTPTADTTRQITRK